MDMTMQFVTPAPAFAVLKYIPFRLFTMSSFRNRL